MDRTTETTWVNRAGLAADESGLAGNPVAPLTPDEECALVQCEEVIRKGWRTFLEVGTALAQIRDNRLYRRQHGTFEHYCREKWGYHRAYAYRLILASQVVAQLSPLGDIPQPTHERQVRPLLGLEPEQMQQAWRKAVEMCRGTSIKAAVVKRMVDELNPDLSNGTKRNQKPPNKGNHPKRSRAKATVLRLITDIERAFSEAEDPDVILGLLGTLKLEVGAL